MTVNELILIESDKVRRDSNLMAFYIKAFTEVFGKAPNCAGCTFKTDWNKLKKQINSGNTTTIQTQKKTLMETFKLKRLQGKIHAYKNEKTKKTLRAYDTNFTDAFVDGFLTHGTKEQIKQRKDLFSVLPEKFQDKPKKEVSEIPTMENTAKEIRAYAELKGIDVSKLTTKAELLEAITSAK